MPTVIKKELVYGRCTEWQESCHQAVIKLEHQQDDKIRQTSSKQ